MIKKWINGFLNKYGYYKLEDLQSGAHCGLCGEWMPDSITPIEWSWDLCEDCCKNESERRIFNKRMEANK